MRFVPVKTANQQADLMLAGERDRLVRQRTQLANMIRGHAAEFGLSERTGINRIDHCRKRSPRTSRCRRSHARCSPGMT